MLSDAMNRVKDKHKQKTATSAPDKKATEKLAKTLVDALNSVMDEWKGLVGASKQLDRLSLGSVWKENENAADAVDLVAPCDGCSRYNRSIIVCAQSHLKPYETSRIVANMPVLLLFYHFSVYFVRKPLTLHTD